MENLSIKLFSIFHKPFIKPAAGFVIPVQGGMVSAKENLGFYGDDTGENISHLNAHFNELTVVYNIWRNNSAKNLPVWGLCHYQRYFYITPPSLLSPSKPLYKKKIQQPVLDKVVNEKLLLHLHKLLKTSDFVVQTPMQIRKTKYNETVKKQFIKFHGGENWDIMKTVLLDKHPEYIDSFENLSSSLKFSAFNMMVGDWQSWDKYLTWLFEILFLLYEKIPPTNHPYQQRAIAFIAERLMNIYLMHNKIKVSYLPVAVFDK